MDSPSNIKSGGLKFAEQQMQRHGWTEGKGLGKHEDGISEAIKVKVKCDSAGVGHNSAEQFTFHWWDHVFNKTASSISVEPDQDGVTVKKLSEDDGLAVSSKKPRKAMLHSNMLYGRFIKSATLTSGGEKPVEERSSSSSDSSDSSEDEDSKLDLSSATKLSDENLMKICGGRTAHKGARHGLTMSAKLSRIEEQERAFMEKYGKKEEKPKPTKSTSEVPSVEEMNGNDRKMYKNKNRRDGNEEEDKPSDSELPKKKKKKKHKKKDCEESVEDVLNGRDQDNVPSNEEDTTTSKKKRSKVLENVEMVEDHKNYSSVEDETTRTAKNKKKKRKTVENEESMIVNGHTEDSKQAKEDKEDGNTGEETGKKKKRRTEDHKEMVDAEDLIGCPEERKNKKQCVDKDVSTEEEENGSSRRRKKEVENKEEEPNHEEDSKVTKKKKKSKHKDRKD